MQRITLSLLICMLAGTVFSQQLPEWQDPDVVEVNLSLIHI